MLTRSLLKYFGIALNIAYYTGNSPYRWDAWKKRLEVSTSPCILSLYFLNVSLTFTLAPYFAAKYIHTMLTSSDGGFTLFSTFNTLLPIIMLLASSMCDFNTIRKWTEFPEAFNHFVHFILRFQGKPVPRNWENLKHVLLEILS
jgi:hypothetical protein